MAEEAKTEATLPTGEELLEGKPVTETTQETISEYTEIEQKALDQGWKPKDKWEGNPDEHRSAREYLDRGELLGKIKSQSSQLNEFRNALNNMSEHNKKVYMAGYDTALKDLKTQKLQALEAGDAAAVLAIDDKIDETKDAIREMKNTPRQQQGPSATTTQWLDDNKWYKTEVGMQRAADGYAVDYARSHPNTTEEDIYEHIDKEIRKDFPHKFQTRKVAPDPEGEGRQVSGSKTPKGATSFSKFLGELTEDQARIARTLVKSGAITEEKYMKDFAAMGG